MSLELTLLGISYVLNIYLIIRLYMASKIINNTAQLIENLMTASDTISQKLAELRGEVEE